MNEHELRSALADVADDQTLAEVWAEVEQRRVGGRARTRGTLVGLTTLAFSVGLVCTWWVLRPAPKLEPLRLTEAPVLGGELAVGPLKLDDASTITPDPGAQLAVLENSGARLQLSLRNGRTRFEVTPNTGRTWRVLAGDVTVEVVGTVFTVDRGPLATRVDVERGVVLVAGERVPGRLVRLEAGQRLELPRAALAVTEVPSPIVDAQLPATDPIAATVATPQVAVTAPVNAVTPPVTQPLATATTDRVTTPRTAPVAAPQGAVTHPVTPQPIATTVATTQGAVAAPVTKTTTTNAVTAPLTTPLTAPVTTQPSAVTVATQPGAVTAPVTTTPLTAPVATPRNTVAAPVTTQPRSAVTVATPRGAVTAPLTPVVTAPVTTPPSAVTVATPRGEDIAPLTTPIAIAQSASTLLEQADAERRAGQLDRARATLATVIDAHPGTAESGLAAFTLGRIHEELGEQRQARLWFSRALAMGLPPPLQRVAELKVRDVP